MYANSFIDFVFLNSKPKILNATHKSKVLIEFIRRLKKVLCFIYKDSRNNRLGRDKTIIKTKLLE